MYNDFHEVCWPRGFSQSSNVVKNKGNVRKKREFYLDYRELYKNFIKQNFCTLEQFLELTLFEVTIKIESDNEYFKEKLTLLETQLNWLAPHSMMGGKYKPIELVKKESKVPVEFEENFELLEEVNEILMNWKGVKIWQCK